MKLSGEKGNGGWGWGSARLLDKRENRGTPTIPLSGGTSATLHCAVRCAHPRHPICSAQPRVPEREREREEGRSFPLQPRAAELYRRIVVPAER